MNNDLISRSALKEVINSNIEQATKVGILVDGEYLWQLLNYAIDNAPTVEPQLSDEQIEKITDLLETEWGYEGIREDVLRILREADNDGEEKMC